MSDAINYGCLYIFAFGYVDFYFADGSVDLHGFELLAAGLRAGASSAPL